MNLRRRREGALPDGDDGRTIVNMNVEGMPWYAPDRPESAAARDGQEGEAPAPAARMTREESRVFLWGAMKAGLLVAGVMCAGLVLFVLFCQFVWFR